MSYGEYAPGPRDNVIGFHVGEQAPQQYNLSTKEWQSPSNWLGKENTSHPLSRSPIYFANIFDVGIFKDTLAPSIALHSGLAVIAWGAGRQYNLLEAKDWLWPAGQVVNAWWSAVGRRLARGEGLSLIANTISWPEKLLLAGVTAWGARLFYRTTSRSSKRGQDDPRYSQVKKEEGFWNKALFKIFLPEALFQAVISLPFTAPFRHQGAVMHGYSPLVQSLAVGLFSAGFALETLADYQQDSHKEESSGLLKDGVWSIVRHPNYLGDALMHASFPLLLFGSDMLAPIELLGPLANYLFIRYNKGTQAEGSQEERYVEVDPIKEQQLETYRSEKNFIWPGISEMGNQWLWVVVGAGASGALLEQALRHVLH